MKLKIIITVAIVNAVACCVLPAQSQSLKTNVIDRIENASDVHKLILRVDKNFNEFKVSDGKEFSDQQCRGLIDSLKIQPWTKADLDDNGLTDLVVNGSLGGPYVICILDRGKNKFELKSISKRFFLNCAFASVTTENRVTAIEYYSQSSADLNSEKAERLEHKTLMYKFGDFIEPNNSPSSHHIEKIQFSTSMCFGPCPVFSMVINADQSAVLNAKKYNTIDGAEIEGTFETTIQQKNFNEIVDLMNYMDFEKLDSNYAVNWTCDQASTMSITYDGGKTKIFHDYGLQGTFSLARLYQLLFALRENQDWTE